MQLWNLQVFRNWKCEALQNCNLRVSSLFFPHHTHTHTYTHIHIRTQCRTIEQLYDDSITPITVFKFHNSQGGGSTRYNAPPWPPSLSPPPCNFPSCTYTFPETARLRIAEHFFCNTSFDARDAAERELYSVCLQKSAQQTCRVISASCDRADCIGWLASKIPFRESWTSVLASRSCVIPVCQKISDNLLHDTLLAMIKFPSLGLQAPWI